MKLGPLNLTWGKKSYNELVTMLKREGSGGITNLKVQPKLQLAEYKSWVSSCVSLISDRISTLPYAFYNKDTGEELSTKNKGYGIYTKPFTNPNDLMSFRFIKAFAQIQLDMCGMSFVYMAKNGLGQVWELWPLNMNDYIKCDVSDDIINPIVKYQFRSGTGYIDFDISELIVLNYVHPINAYVGASPIQAQAYAQDIDSYIEVYERDFFKNSARIDFALTTDEKIDQEKADELKERWKEKYQGTFHDVAVLDSGLKPVPMQYANRDFEFLNLANWTREKVLAAYRVPKSKLGFTEGNRQGNVQDDIAFNKESIQPRLSLWDEEITKEVMPTFNDRIEFRHQNPIPRDRLIEVQEGRIHVAVPTLTVNEFREKIHGLEKVVGGEEIYVPKDMIPMSKVNEVIDAQITAQTATDEEDDDRDDEPDSHVNPDGSDDRDDNPTDGRSIDALGNEHFKYLYDKIRKVLHGYLQEKIIELKADNFKRDLQGLFLEITTALVQNTIDYFGIKPIDVKQEDWIFPMVNYVVDEFEKTIFKDPKWKEQQWDLYLLNQFNSNVRLPKLVNALSRASINYVKWLVFTNKNVEMIWVVNGNECGHRGKLKKEISSDYFKIGNMKMKFPNEILNFSCDCTITENK